MVVCLMDGFECSLELFSTSTSFYSLEVDMTARIMFAWLWSSYVLTI